MKNLNDLLNNALLLPENERAILVKELIVSLDTSIDIESEKEWQQEISKREKELDEGKSKLIPWEKVKKQLRRS